jgi:MurNAc alpha-1-phosphate uridylyltransferase
MKINTALVLCAGYGKRLNPLTLKNPKPLLKLNNLTLLENTINLIKKLGINEIKLNTFYLKDQIKIFIEEKNFDVKIEIIEDGNEILDTGGGIFNMINSLNEENFMVFNPDTVWSIDYLNCIKEMENFYFSKKIQNILMVVNKDLSFDKNLKGDFDLLDNQINKKKLNQYIFTGCQIINKKVFASIKNKSFSILQIWNDLIKENKLYGYESKNKFYHVTDLEIYNKLLKSY